jgi:hypothetical protein
VRRSKADALDAYIDPKDLSASTSRLLIWPALKTYSVKALIPMLSDPEIEVSTTAARLLQVRGDRAVWGLARKLCDAESIRERVIGLFILGQLGTPRLPYKSQTLDLIASLLSHRQPTIIVEQALYSIGHLRQGQPLEHDALLKRITTLKVRKGSDLATAKAFALR